MTVVFLLLLLVVLIAAGPLLVIWALNTLFPVLAIDYTIWTWFATLILMSIFSASHIKSNK